MGRQLSFGRMVLAVVGGTIESISCSNQSISHDCSTCHNLLAADEANPKILSDLGIAPEAAPGSPQK